MGLAVWCDLEEGGHAFDERQLITVTWKDDWRYFCQRHCKIAFVTAFDRARAEGQSDISLPTLRASFTIRPSADDQAGEDKPARNPTARKHRVRNRRTRNCTVRKRRRTRRSAPHHGLSGKPRRCWRSWRQDPTAARTPMNGSRESPWPGVTPRTRAMLSTGAR